MSKISLLFDGISARYDRFNCVASFGADARWRRIATKSLPKCNSLLDIATGTADFCIEIAQQQKATHIIGTDISTGMLKVAELKIKQKNFSTTINLQLADCANLPFANNSFDAITCAFGVRNFENLQKGLSEMFRVLKNGGQLRILEFSYPKNKFVRFFYKFYFTRIIPILGGKITGDKQAFLYFTNSVKNFPKGEEFMAVLQEIGFCQVEEKSLSFGVTSLYSACRK